jgi:hypothetical protein
MKTKKFSKKLMLNKKTIANLGNDELSQVRGGRVTVTCPIECQTNEPRCTAAGCITFVEPYCETIIDCVPTYWTITMCTFYCP